MYHAKPKLEMNTITQLICFLVFAVLMNQLSFIYIMAISSLLISTLFYIKSKQFFKMIKRMKWFFVVMLLIFILNTPGQHIQGWDYLISPTYEGLASGLLQVFRMIALLASLSLIMAVNTKQQLISGFYFLLLPMRAVGVKVERFAARLWLTLEYVESSQQLDKQSEILKQLKTAGSSNSSQQVFSSIIFEMPIFRALDNLVICSLVFIGIYALLRALI